MRAYTLVGMPSAIASRLVDSAVRTHLEWWPPTLQWWLRTRYMPQRQLQRTVRTAFRYRVKLQTTPNLINGCDKLGIPAEAGTQAESKKPVRAGTAADPVHMLQLQLEMRTHLLRDCACGLARCMAQHLWLHIDIIAVQPPSYAHPYLGHVRESALRLLHQHTISALRAFDIAPYVCRRARPASRSIVA